jgi:hypothetical protein
MAEGKMTERKTSELFASHSQDKEQPALAGPFYCGFSLAYKKGAMKKHNLFFNIY